jgi:hypothetical protein
MPSYGERQTGELPNGVLLDGRNILFKKSCSRHEGIWREQW